MKLRGGELKIMQVREGGEGLWGQGHMRAPADAAALWHNEVEQASWYRPEQECCVVAMLDAKNGIKGWTMVSVGLLDTSLVHARETFRAAVLGAARSIVLLHNHPSGDPTPSAEDVRITRKLVEAGRVLEINVLDHVVIGGRDPGFTSMRELGLVDFSD